MVNVTNFSELIALLAAILLPDESLPVSPSKVTLASFNTLDNVAAFGSAGNIALNTDHRGQGANSVEWDKIAGAILGAITYNPPVPINISEYSTHSQVMWFMNVPTPVGGTIVAIYVALGTDNANLFYWQIPNNEITYDAWEHYHLNMANVTGVLGAGANLSAISYVAVYVQTSVAGATVTNILVDEVVVKRVFEVNQIRLPPSAIIEGQVILTGVAQQLPNETCQSVTLENPITNNVVVIGHDNTVTLLNGYRLQPGATWNIAIDNVNRIWVIGTAAQVISYGGVN